MLIKEKFVFKFLYFLLKYVVSVGMINVILLRGVINKEVLVILIL